jgi:hypothetical protein
VPDPTAWLVDGGMPICEGTLCANPSRTTPFDMQFQFPYSGEFWSKFCIDAAGRIMLAQTSTDCVNKWDVKPNTDEFLHGADLGTGIPDTPSIAPLWGSIVPCNRFEEASCSWTGFWRSGGDLACDTPAWPCHLGCDIKRWRAGNSCASPGEIRSRLTAFEGTTAMVVTWGGFDGYFNPRNGGPDHGINFQVIMRIDGRITFFYRQPPGGAADWRSILNLNGWLVGLSGKRSVSCASDDDCNSTFNSTGLTCDVTNHVMADNIVWEARKKCMNTVDLQTSAGVPVFGSWIGE